MVPTVLYLILKPPNTTLSSPYIRLAYTTAHPTIRLTVANTSSARLALVKANSEC